MVVVATDGNYVYRLHHPFFLYSDRALDVLPFEPVPYSKKASRFWVTVLVKFFAYYLMSRVKHVLIPSCLGASYTHEKTFLSMTVRASVLLQDTTSWESLLLDRLVSGVVGVAFRTHHRKK